MKKIFFSIGLCGLIALHASSQTGVNPILQQAKIAIGLTNLKKPILHYYYNQANLGREQSDRTYPPFYTTTYTGDAWLNTEINTTFVKNSYIGGGYGPAKSSNTYYTGVSKYYYVRDTTYTPNSSFAEYDKLNAWTVLLDWADDNEVKQIKNQVYRVKYLIIRI
jgi:hypothetical protein